VNATSRLSKMVSLTAPLELARLHWSEGPAAAKQEWAVSLRTRRRGLPRRFIHEIFDTTGVEVRFAFAGRYASQDPYEMAALALAAAATNPKKIVEIGTFRGATARLLAANAPDATVYTLDLPHEMPRGALPTNTIDDEILTTRGGPMLYEDTPEAERIVQLWGDSATFDFDIVGHDIDLAFIDGAHTYEYVKNDTEKLLPRMRPGGVMIWDDYWDPFPGVVQYVNELKPPGAAAVVATAMVVWRLPDHRIEIGSQEKGMA
jgi:predicted O-methyltransferase YrrM